MIDKCGFEVFFDCDLATLDADRRLDAARIFAQSADYSGALVVDFCKQMHAAALDKNNLRRKKTELRLHESLLANQQAHGLAVKDAIAALFNIDSEHSILQ